MKPQRRWIRRMIETATTETKTLKREAARARRQGSRPQLATKPVIRSTLRLKDG